MNTNFLKFIGSSFYLTLTLICASLFIFQKPALSASQEFILNWTCNSYVPLDYLGKALPTRNSEITVWAMPTKKMSINPESLNYRWLLDDEIMGWAGGRGKTTFKFAASKWAGQSHAVQVQILDNNEQLLFSKTISISIVNPQTILTTKDGQPFGEEHSTQNGQTLSIFAQPLFFNVSNFSQLLFAWSVDNIKINMGSANPERLELTIPKVELSSPIFKTVDLTTSNPNDEFERSSTSLNLQIN